MRLAIALGGQRGDQGAHLRGAAAHGLGYLVRRWNQEPRKPRQLDAFDADLIEPLLALHLRQLGGFNDVVVKFQKGGSIGRQ